MPSLDAQALKRLLICLAGLLILKVTGSVLLKYRDYFPPNFDSEFLQGRESYFWGSYRWAFYTHIAAGPVSLLLGTVLISDRFRRSVPKWHRRLGRFQGLTVLFLVAPSGLCMAYRAQAGPIAAVGFALLALLTGATVVLGWRAAVQRRYGDHRRWMWRCFLLLCSTVVLRLIAGLATVLEIQGAWVEPLAAWLSWALPLAALELSSIGWRKLAAPGANRRSTPGVPA